MKKVLNVGVVGGGSFGTALATVAARCGHNVKIFSKTERTIQEINTLRKNTRFFPDDIILPENLIRGRWFSGVRIGSVSERSQVRYPIPPDRPAE